MQKQTKPYSQKHERCSRSPKINPKAKKSIEILRHELTESTDRKQDRLITMTRGGNTLPKVLEPAHKMITLLNLYCPCATFNCLIDLLLILIQPTQVIQQLTLLFRNQKEVSLNRRSVHNLPYSTTYPIFQKVVSCPLACFNRLESTQPPTLSFRQQSLAHWCILLNLPYSGIQ